MIHGEIDQYTIIGEWDDVTSGTSSLTTYMEMFSTKGETFIVMGINDYNNFSTKDRYFISLNEALIEKDAFLYILKNRINDSTVFPNDGENTMLLSNIFLVGNFSAIGACFGYLERISPDTNTFDLTTDYKEFSIAIMFCYPTLLSHMFDQLMLRNMTSSGIKNWDTSMNQAENVYNKMKADKAPLRFWFYPSPNSTFDINKFDGTFFIGLPSYQPYKISLLQ